MSTAAAEVERETLYRLRERFEAEGYRFILEPAKDSLPDFLQNRRPDALAFGPNETVVIEAKHRRTKDSDILLTHLAQEISSRPGWRLLVVYTGEIPDDIVELRRAEQSQIDLALQDVRKLTIHGPNRIVLVAAWSMFEALARSLYTEGDLAATRALSPMQVVERLASDGYLTLNEAQRLRTLISTRNRAVHGDLTVNISDEDIRFMLDKAEEINRIAND